MSLTSTLSRRVGNLSEGTIKDILLKYRTVAVIGLSPDPSKPSHVVAEYLMRNGFRIVPVNPLVEKVLGERSHKNLLEIPVKIQKSIEIVDIFRRSEDVPPIVEQAVQLKKLFGLPYVIWMQLGIVNEPAATVALKEGLKVIMNKCIRQEHQRLFSNS
jgi:predicted CoA-binding protein